MRRSKTPRQANAIKGNSEVLKHLNKILNNELVAINQYFLDSKMFKDWGLTELAEHEYHESIDEMKHADALVERILFLEGITNLQDLSQPRIGETPKEMLECDLQLGHIAHTDLVATIQRCEKENDLVSRDLAKTILEAEEEHVDWLKTQLWLIERVGEQNYLQTAMKTVKPAA